MRAAHNKSTVNVGQDKQEHASQDRRDEDFVKQVHEVNQRERLWARLIVTQPSIGETGCCCIWVALLTFHQQVLLVRDSRLRIIWFQNVMNAMAVCTNRFIRRLIGIVLVEHLHCRAMEVSYVCTQHISR